MGKIEYIRLGEENHRVRDGDELGAWIADEFSSYNTDEEDTLAGDNTLTEREILAAFKDSPELETEMYSRLGSLQKERDKYVDDSYTNLVLNACTFLEDNDSAIERLKCYYQKLEPRTDISINLPFWRLVRLPQDELADKLERQPDLELRAESVAKEMGRDEIKATEQYCNVMSKFSKPIELLCESMTELAFPDRYTSVFGQGMSYEDCLLKSESEIKNDSVNFYINTSGPALQERNSDNNLYFDGYPLFNVTFGSKDDENFFTRNIYLLSSGNTTEYSEYVVNERHLNRDLCGYKISADFVKKYISHIDTAVSLLTRAHPHIEFENFKSVFLLHLVDERQAISNLDAWQDLSLCFEVGCAHLEGYRKAYPEYNDPALLAAWSAASAFFGNKLHQGYGPFQIIPQLALEAASRKDISARYSEYLTDEELTTEAGCMRAILDPVKAIYYLALIYDFIITRLEETVMRDKSITFPTNGYPYISDYKLAREMTLLDTAKDLTVFPEDDINAKRIILYGAANNLWTRIFDIADLFNVKHKFYGLKLASSRYPFLSYMRTGGKIYDTANTMRAGPFIDVKYLVPTEYPQEYVAERFSDAVNAFTEGIKRFLRTFNFSDSRGQ